ncbi:hypothetical protein V1499_17160 [Neobacillus sp. SCS-31]|uniref:hypothetical protein n=1 Tax=Neobacillus oceani TaxID=3115292 RepID=UPI0039065624
MSDIDLAKSNKGVTQTQMSDIDWAKSKKEVTQTQMSDIDWAKSKKEVTQAQMGDIDWAKSKKEVTQTQISDIDWAKSKKEVTETQMSDIVWAKSKKEVTQTQMSDIDGPKFEKEVTQTQMSDIGLPKSEKKVTQIASRCHSTQTRDNKTLTTHSNHRYNEVIPALHRTALLIFLPSFAKTKAINQERCRRRIWTIIGKRILKSAWNSATGVNSLAERLCRPLTVIRFLYTIQWTASQRRS